jgi:hypothetical protein
VAAGGPAPADAPADDPEPDPADKAAWAEWGLRQLDLLTGGGQQRDRGGTADIGAPDPAPPLGKKVFTNKGPEPEPAGEQRQSVADNGVLLPPPPPKGVKYGDQLLVPKSPYREYPKGPR